MNASIRRSSGADRSNPHLAAAVDEALIILEQQGCKAAADYLTKRGVGVALTCRVLTEPQRQVSDLQHRTVIAAVEWPKMVEIL